jgi:uncharacterized protein YdhG (YjbR/CyaY superfamily)
VLLLDQDRARWDRLLIRRGLAALERARGAGRRARARTRCRPRSPPAMRGRARPRTPTGPRIAALYDALAQVAPSPVVELNRAVAARWHTVRPSGLELVDALLDARTRPARYHLLPSVRGELLIRLGRLEEADATEAFSYRIPTFKQKGQSLVWYAAFKDHYSIYPYTEGLLAALGEELEPHISGKGTLRFEMKQPIPTDLIERIVRARLSELDATYKRRS